MENKKSRTRLSIAERCAIIKSLEDGELPNKLAKKYNVTRQCICQIKKNKGNISKIKRVLEKCEGNWDSKRYCGKEADIVEEKIYEWCKQRRAMGFPITGPILQEKAVEFNKFFGNNNNFIASNGWLDRFKKRHGLKPKSVPGEKLSADVEANEDLKMKINNLRRVAGINLDYIYNCDETGLYWKMMPNKTLVGGNEQQTEERKKPKDRLTLMLCTNASGTHKLPLFAIGESAQPRCFKGVKSFPVTYTSQKNCWMTCGLMKLWYTTIFLPEIEKKYDLKNNKNIKIILIMDNAGCHPRVEEFNNISNVCDVIFLPANVTAAIQPLNQGIIEKFKRCYRFFFLKKILTADGDQFNGGMNLFKQFNLLQCFNICCIAWNEVTPENIRMCWKNLIPLNEDNIPNSEICSVDVSSIQAILQLCQVDNALSDQELQYWLNIDNHEIGWKPRSDSEILLGTYPDNNIDEDNSDCAEDPIEHDDEEITPVDSMFDCNDITTNEALNTFEKFLMWYQRHGEHYNFNRNVFERCHKELIIKAFEDMF